MNLNNIYQKTILKRQEKMIKDKIEFEQIKEQYNNYINHLESEYEKSVISGGKILIRKYGIGVMIISDTFIIS
jgi:hypothetical protein